ncbi:hypothetical protein EJB05_09038, partial [Eragrostis curvula]
GTAAYTSYQNPMQGYYGAMATFDIYNFPTLKKGFQSAANMALHTSKEAIQAGWEINPTLYGDNKTHFFVYYNVDIKYDPGCSNLVCDGFVPNKEDGDWWIHTGRDTNNLTPVGYWPKSLFTTMRDNATSLFWGGTTVSPSNEPSPPMGNGQWPGELSAFVRDIQYIDASGQGNAPESWLHNLRAEVSNNKCYQVSSLTENMFHYGGPGGCTKN